MKFVRYNYRFKTLVNFIVGVTCGRVVQTAHWPTALNWTLAVIAVPILYLILNYRPTFGGSRRPD